MLYFIATAALAFSTTPTACPDCPEPETTTCPDPAVPQFDVTAKFNGCGAAYPPQTYGQYIDVFNGYRNSAPPCLVSRLATHRHRPLPCTA